MNLLRNPEFDMPYPELPKYSSIQTAEHWTAWWKTGTLQWSEDFPFEQGTPFRQPEFKPLPRSVFPKRVPVGNTSQCLFTVHAPMWAGVCQYDIPVPQGRTIRFGFKAQAWCSNHEDPYGKSEGEMYARLLLRHGGGRRWDSEWEWHPQWVPIGLGWKSIEWELVAKEPVISVGIAAWAKWAFKHNDAIISDAWLKAQGEPPPDPGPSPEPPSSNEILETKIWFVKRQLEAAENDATAAEGTVAYWRSILVDLEQPGLLTRTQEHFAGWLRKLL